MDGYRDQIVTHDVGVSLHSKTHPLFMKYSNGTSTVLCISLSEFVSCAFSTIPICPFLIPRIFDLLVSTLFLLQIACEFPVGLCIYTQHTNEMCASSAKVLNFSTDCSPQNVLTCILALDQETVATRL